MTDREIDERGRIDVIVKRLGITSKNAYVSRTPMSTTPRAKYQFIVYQDNWKVTLRSSVTKRSMTIPYMLGEGHGGAEPKLADVLESLMLDASTADTRDYSWFCSEFGYDEDSRSAERTYKGCVKAYDKLCKFLGFENLHWLLYGGERDDQ